MMRMRNRIAAALGALLFPLLPVTAQLPAPKLAAGKIETAKHTITPAPSGLPQQIFIKAGELELPLRVRGQKAGPAVLQAIGRGPILAGPIAVKVVAGGTAKAAAVKKAAKPTIQGGAVRCRSELQAGSTGIVLDLSYGADGSITGSITYGGGKVSALELVIPLGGRVDTVVAGPPGLR